MAPYREQNCAPRVERWRLSVKTASTGYEGSPNLCWLVPATDKTWRRGHVGHLLRIPRSRLAGIDMLARPLTGEW